MIDNQMKFKKCSFAKFSDACTAILNGEKGRIVSLSQINSPLLIQHSILILFFTSGSIKFVAGYK